MGVLMHFLCGLSLLSFFVLVLGTNFYQVCIFLRAQYSGIRMTLGLNNNKNDMMTRLGHVLCSMNTPFFAFFFLSLKSFQLLLLCCSHVKK